MGPVAAPRRSGRRNAGVLPCELGPDPLEMDPRPCEWCGLTIDRHRRVDTAVGPEFFCEDLEIQIHLDAAPLVRRWELADSRDAWRHTGEPPPKARDVPKVPPDPYRTPHTTIYPFFF